MLNAIIAFGGIFVAIVSLKYLYKKIFEINPYLIILSMGLIDTVSEIYLLINPIISSMIDSICTISVVHVYTIIITRYTTHIENMYDVETRVTLNQVKNFYCLLGGAASSILAILFPLKYDYNNPANLFIITLFCTVIGYVLIIVRHKLLELSCKETTKYKNQTKLRLCDFLWINKHSMQTKE